MKLLIFIESALCIAQIAINKIVKYSIIYFPAIW